MPQISEIAFCFYSLNIHFSITSTGTEAAVGVSGILARGGFPASVIDDMTYYRLFAESVMTHVVAVEQDRFRASSECDETRYVYC